jgi:hypothetical protein
MTPPKPRRLWIVHAELPAPLTIEAWSVEARALGFSDMEAARLCWWRWLTSIDPERIERWKERPSE